MPKLLYLFAALALTTALCAKSPEEFLEEKTKEYLSKVENADKLLDKAKQERERAVLQATKDFIKDLEKVKAYWTKKGILEKALEAKKQIDAFQKMVDAAKSADKEIPKSSVVGLVKVPRDALVYLTLDESNMYEKEGHFFFRNHADPSGKTDAQFFGEKPTFVKSEKGKYLSFDGNTHLAIPGLIMMTNNNDDIVSATIFFSQTGAPTGLAKKMQSSIVSKMNEFHFGYDKTGELTVGTYGHNMDIVACLEPKLNKWYEIDFQYNEGKGKLKIKSKTRSWKGKTKDLSPESKFPLEVGRLNSTAGAFYFVGSIAKVVVYKKEIIR